MSSLRQVAGRWFYSAVLAGFAVASCSSDDSSEDAASDGAGGQSVTLNGSGGANATYAAGGTSSSGFAQGGYSQGGRSTTTSAVGTGGANLGQVLVTQFATNVLGEPTLLPTFHASVPSSPCPNQTLGNCTFSPNCPAATMGTTVSAGTVTLTVPNLAYDVSIAPADGATYVSATFEARLVPGDVLHVATSGATVPAFAADVTVLDRLRIDAPAADASGRIVASSAEDLVVDFSSGASGVYLVVQGVSNAGSVSCSVSSTAGTVTLPATLLSTLGAGTVLSLFTFAKQTIKLGSWEIESGFLTEADSTTPSRSASVRIQ
jgi:hypothetical protein